MKMRLLSAALAATLACVSPIVANAQSGLVAEAGYAEAFEVQGAELGLGWRFSARNFHLTPVVGGFVYQADNDRYYRDTLGNGQTRCRDGSNGQFARDNLCNDGAVDAYGRLEATFNIRQVEAGVGYRVSEEDSVPYGTVSVKFGDMWALKINAGEDYVGAGLVLRR